MVYRGRLSLGRWGAVGSFVFEIFWGLEFGFGYIYEFYCFCFILVV